MCACNFYGQTLKYSTFLAFRPLPITLNHKLLFVPAAIIDIFCVKIILHNSCFFQNVYLKW